MARSKGITLAGHSLLPQSQMNPRCMQLPIRRHFQAPKLTEPPPFGHPLKTHARRLSPEKRTQNAQANNHCLEGKRETESKEVWKRW